MREMNDSGIEWIGAIPIHWKCCRQKYEIQLLNGRAYKDTEFEEDGTYKILRVGNLYSNSTWYTSSLELAQTKYCFNGDLLYSWSMSYGPHIWHGDKVIYHYHIWKAELKNDMVMKYAYYYLLALTNNIKAETHETTMGFVTMGNMNNSYIVVPPCKEQILIATYLDKTCSKLDSIYDDIQHQIELLQEYKQSVITEAVTKGLDKNVAMKDSNEFIGKIPQSWSICKVKHVSDFVTDGAHISPDTSEEEYLFLSVTDMDDYGNLNFDNCLRITTAQYNYLVRTGCKPQKNDVIISKDGTIGKTTIIETDKDFVVASSLVIIHPSKNKIIAKYLRYSLMSKFVQEQLQMLLAGSALKRVSVGKNANLKIVYTSNINEQEDIIDYLDKKCAEIDAILADKQKQLDTLTEYKKSLIYEYVTGKKEVPADA